MLRTAMPINIAKTEKYYAETAAGQLCTCEDCQNYAANIKAAYPELAAYLASLGANIETPFETFPLYAEKGLVHFHGVQYVLLGSGADFEKVSVSGFDIDIAVDHPMTCIDDEHFVIEIWGEICVPHTIFLEYPKEERKTLFSKLIRKIKK